MNTKSRFNVFFEKVYVITCDSFNERHEYINNHFYKNNVKFDFFVSVDPKLLSADVISSTEKSLSMSHLNCVINAKLNGYKSIMICEDDINFVNDIEENFNNFSKNIPLDWNFLQIGNQIWAEKWLRRKYIAENLYKFEWGTGSHCIGINSNSYDVLINNFKKLDAPVDFMYYKLYSELNCYCPEKFLADALSKNDHINHYDTKYIFDSTIVHKNV
jgi:GR25 family glycosyltransferase involved in LPS biosynthesis